MPASERLRLLLAFGGLYFLIIVAGPAFGLVGIPVSFFLKNKLHLQANQLAQFNLWTSLPLLAAFVFGMARDRWSPFGGGDRGHLIAFGALTAAVYAVEAFLPPTFGVLLAGLLIAGAAYQMMVSAAAGFISTLGQQHGVTGQASSLVNAATALAVTSATLLGGFLSEALEGQAANAAARCLFLVASGLMTAVALISAFSLRRLFAAVHAERRAPRRLGDDIARLLRHRPIYPALLIWGLWQINPLGIALQYHLTNKLHASDSQYGVFAALSFIAGVPGFLLYAVLCQRVRLGRLLLWCTLVALPSALPFLFIHSITGALVCGSLVGLAGGAADAAFFDLAIRSCPSGLQGTVMMVITALIFAGTRFGDLWGTFLYEHHGGLSAPVIAATIANIVILPVLWLVPRRLVSTTDNQMLVA